VNIELSEEAAEYGRQARRAFEAAGGDLLVQQAEAEPGRRESLVAPVLAELDAWDLSPRRDPAELEAAAALCRSAGYWAVPYPVAERLGRPPDLDVDGLVVVADTVPAAAVAHLDRRWAAVTLDGGRRLAVARPAGEPPRDSAFVVRLDLWPADYDGNGERDAALGLVLPCWTLLGMLDRAMELTRAHVLTREQFGQRLAAFQGVQFQLTEAEVERAGAEILAKYALWSLTASPAGGSSSALDDALALRLAAVEAAEVVFRVAHQLHGAIGFCDETPLSWLSRYSQPLRRLPFGRSGTRTALTDRIGSRGLPGLFGASQDSAEVTP
jgi:3-oxo-4-pregnene-20-carboxyl-CoA dehydrogenase alpha subunit